MASRADVSLPDKIVSLHESLSRARLPHAFGGALALAYYAEPRATIDIDLNLFVATERWERVLEAIAPLGVDAAGLDPEALVRDGQCRLWWDDNAVDLFFAYDALHDAMRDATRRVPFAATTIPVLSAEHLLICKAVFDRPRDWIDIEQMLLAADELDLGEIEAWLTRMAGADDPRMQRLAELTDSLQIER